MKAIQNGITTRRSMLVGTNALVAFASGLARTSTAQPVSASDRPRVTNPSDERCRGSLVEAYIYLYPLVVFGVSYEVLTNVADLRPLAPHLNERARRLFAASEAHAAGRGGVTVVAEATGVARSTDRPWACGTAQRRFRFVALHPPPGRWSQTEG